MRNLCLILLVCSQPFTAQNSTEQPSPVFKSETRQVLVDVVVNDRGGHFIPGLKPGSFTVLEDGKAQKIAAFGVHAQAAHVDNCAAEGAGAASGFVTNQFGS